MLIAWRFEPYIAKEHSISRAGKESFFSAAPALHRRIRNRVLLVINVLSTRFTVSSCTSSRINVVLREDVDDVVVAEELVVGRMEESSSVIGYIPLVMALGSISS